MGALLPFLFFAGMLDTVQEAMKAIAVAPAAASAMPEETAWQMIYMEGGVLAVLLAIGVTVLWRVVSKVLEESRAQSRELLQRQADAISKLAESMIRVEHAVKLSDTNNQAAINRLSDTVSGAIARLDRHELKLETQNSHLMEHSHRIQALETGSHRILPAVPGNPR